jgi:hypothetical protein
MKAYRIPFVLFFLLLTFTWTGLVHADQTLDIDGKMKIILHEDGKFKRAEDKDGNILRKNDLNKRKVKLIIEGVEGQADVTLDVISVTDGAIIKGRGSDCITYWDGNEYVEYCW